MDRRRFLSTAVFFTVAAAVSACNSSSNNDDGDEERGKEAAGTYLFPQGVASGDPKASSIVFWSRCIRQNGRQDPIDVLLEVSADASFATLLASVPLTASPLYDFTVRAKVTGLPAAKQLYYRFVADNDYSVSGSSRTAPAVDSMPDKLRFAWFNCQDWSVNHWGAMSMLAQEELDFVVHVGDYIYETVGAAFQSGAAEPAHSAIRFPDGIALGNGSGFYASTTADYRTLYRTYRSDPRLQAIHAKFAMIAIWDDHEFSDDCWQDHTTYINANPQQTERRRSANQAWVEYMPVDFGDVSFDLANPAYDNIRIYRDFHFGTLMHLVMTDERLYRDDHIVSEALIAETQGHDPVNGSDSVGARNFVQLPVLQQIEAQKTTALGRAPSILGVAQTQWWKNTMKTSPATWKVWGNELMLSRMWLDLRGSAPAPYDAQYVVNCDAWDGFPSHKADLLGFLKTENIQNVVAITGDLHAFQCGVVRDLPDPVNGTPVLVDFLCAGISSSSFYSYVKEGAAGTPLEALVASPEFFDGVLRMNNPDFRFIDHNAQGYASATLTAGKLEVIFNKVKPLQADGTVPSNPVLKRTRITLAAGSLEPVIEDNV